MFGLALWVVARALSVGVAHSRCLLQGIKTLGSRVFGVWRLRVLGVFFGSGFSSLGFPGLRNRV